MIAKLSLCLLAIVALALIAGLAVRQRFKAHLDALETSVRRCETSPEPRLDLPPEVAALARKLGARAGGGPAFVAFEQTGQMWSAPGAAPMAFTARQTMCITEPGFIWRALMGPGGAAVVADYLVEGVGGLEAKLAGALPIARMVGTGGVAQGEGLRYLGELPWNPDAILANRRLEWSVAGPGQLKVSLGSGSDRAEVTLVLNAEGLVETMSASSRLYAAKGRVTRRPWHGRFWDYEPIAGRLMPRGGEVAWNLDGEDFVYWRGRIDNWRRGPTLTDTASATPPAQPPAR